MATDHAQGGARRRNPSAHGLLSKAGSLTNESDRVALRRPSAFARLVPISGFRSNHCAVPKQLNATFFLCSLQQRGWESVGSYQTSRVEL